MAVGFSRIYLGVHYLTDVLAATLVAGACLILAVAALHLLDPREPPGRGLIGPPGRFTFFRHSRYDAHEDMASANAVPPSRPTSGTGSQYDPDAYDICRPTIPAPENETDSEKIDRIQREFEALRDCVNGELKVRTESSLLTLIILKVVLPFTAIAAGMTALYVAFLRAGESQSDHAELILGIAYLVIAAGAIALWRTSRKPGSGGRGDAVDRSVRGALNLTVPPNKEKLTRNKLVNRWIFFWLTWGLIIGLPLIFFLFRADVLERAGLKLVFDTANVCAPTVGRL